MGSYLQTHGGVPLDHPRRCTAHRQDGSRVAGTPLAGRTCAGYMAEPHHKSWRKRVNASPSPPIVMARELLGIAISAESEAVKLAAVKDALDRAGLGAKTEVSP